MKTLFVFLTLALAAPASAGGIGDFRACVAAAPQGEAIHHCTAAVAAPCGDQGTAAAAAGCISAAESRFEGEIDKVVVALSAMTGEADAAIRDALEGERSSGAAACRMMADRDEAQGVAVGQRAVNAAFCRLIAAGDTLATLIRLEAK